MSHGVIANLPNIENLGSTTKCCGLVVVIELKSDLSIKRMGASYIYKKQKKCRHFFHQYRHSGCAQSGAIWITAGVILVT